MSNMAISSNTIWGFPLIRDLPLLVKTDGWDWEEFSAKRNFWVGTDSVGDFWIVKLRGKFGAVHEHVYADFAQTLGICTQSSVFVILDELATPLRGQRHPDKVPHNVGIWKLPKHDHRPCGSSCPYNNTPATANDWPEWGIRNPWNKIEARFLGYLCGMSEPTQDLITTSHLWVQIDNELTFGQWAFERGKAYDNIVCEVSRDPWLRIDGVREKLRLVCERISDVSDAEIERIVAIPSEYRCRTRVAVLTRYLRQTRRTATNMRRNFFKK